MKTTTDSDMKQIFIEAMWWDIKNDKPHNVFIEGDKSTRLNLGWFIKKESIYELTEAGIIAYNTFLKNRNR